jgi:hypothetical protein
MRGVAAVILACIGLAMLVTAFFLYPRTSEAPIPGYPELAIYASSSVAVENIEYNVEQISATSAHVLVTVDLFPYEPTRGLSLEFTLPSGTVFVNCHPSACDKGNLAIPGHQNEPLIFHRGSSGPSADANFVVKAGHYGLTSDGLTTSVVIPQVNMQTYDHNRTEPMLTAVMWVPSGTSYDWSAFAPIGLGTARTIWQEQIASDGFTPSRVVIGINHAAQTRHDTLVLVAGILFGVGGGALVAAAQEALHAND